MDRGGAIVRTRTSYPTLEVSGCVRGSTPRRASRPFPLTRDRLARLANPDIAARTIPRQAHGEKKNEKKLAGLAEGSRRALCRVPNQSGCPASSDWNKSSTRNRQGIPRAI